MRYLQSGCHHLHSYENLGVHFKIKVVFILAKTEYVILNRGRHITLTENYRFSFVAVFTVVELGTTTHYWNPNYIVKTLIKKHSWKE